MGQFELSIAVMGGLLLSAFLIVGEIAALRKRVPKFRDRWRQYYREGRYGRILAEFCGIVVFFLIQPALVALLVALALGNLSPQFSQNTLYQLRQYLDTNAK